MTKKNRILAPVLLDGAWRPARDSGSFNAFDPTTGLPLSDLYPVSTFEDAEEAVLAGQKAARELELIPVEGIAAFLDRFAEQILARIDDLIEIAHLETALPKEPRLRTIELPRTINQLHQSAEAIRDGSWRQATIETKLNIRSIRGPIGGPIVVFSPNNFPFAYNAVAGGDFAAALAAGNPVIAKGHPAHPGTTRLFAKIGMECLQESGLPPATIQMIYHLIPEDGLKLVAHPSLGATAFTGSRSSGLKLKNAADLAGKPIFLEMSSVNPVFMLPGAIEERGPAIAAELFGSCSLGAGQFCTKPGLAVVLDDKSVRAFLKSARIYFRSLPSGYLLSRDILESVQAAVEELKKNGAEILVGGSPISGPGFQFENTLLLTSGERFLQNPISLQREVFGTVTLIVLVESDDQMIRIAEALEGSLSAGVYSKTNGEDDDFYNHLAPILRTKTGRLLNDKMPTGLAVVPATVHGGPFPASGHPGFTSVGIPASILRFTALRCYDNVRKNRLPHELRDKNPTGRMWRLLDGVWTQKDGS